MPASIPRIPSLAMLGRAFLLLALVAGAHARVLAPKPVATADVRPHVPGVNTNAGRLARGLAPLKPKALWTGAHVRRQSEPSGLPTITQKGFLYAIQSGESPTGCVISDGTWYVGGSCATYTEVLSGNSATFSSSKGPCTVTSLGTFSCASGDTATTFTVTSDGTLTYEGSTDFSADQVPANSVRQTIYTGAEHAVPLSLNFVVGANTVSTSASSTSASSTSSTSRPYPTGTGLTVCSAQTPSSFELSCSSASVANTCCTDSPGGHLLQTQFWDTGSTSTGPNNSWTLHGLWPDNCDGTYQQYCDTSRETSNVRGTLQSNGQTDLLAYMDVYWKDYQGDDESFWEHEYNKHGTCISSLEPQCFNNYYASEDLVIYFQRAVGLFQTLPSYDWLAQAGIVPSLTATYTLSQIQSALGAHFGGGININCNGNTFDELWYHYRSQGGVASGNLVPAAAVGSGSTCPATGIRWLPKYVDTTAPPASSSVSTSATSSVASTSSTSSTASPTSSPTASAKGFIYPTYPNGTVEAKACLISDGTWYKGGSCASYTLNASAQSSGSYTLSTSKGLCAVDANALTCASTVTTAADFTVDGSGVISFAASTAFSADAVPSGSTRRTVYIGGDHAVPFILKFTSS